MYTITKPKILLIGNGILRAFGGESWTNFLDSINTRKDDLPKIDKIDCPSPLKAIIVTGDHVDAAMKKKFSNPIVADGLDIQQVAILQDILSLGFDHILTTNYTYELEAAAIYPKGLTKYRLEKMQKSTAPRAEGKYLLHTYMELPFGDKKSKVWHIHGEARKPDSVVLGHYYYGNLLREIEKEIRIIDDCRWKGKRNKNASWIDAFLFGDIYCLGFGFGLCEFDLWWLLNRKAREKHNTGRLYFYEPKPKRKFDTKLDLLKLLKSANSEQLVEPFHCGFEESKMKDADYRSFYISALNDIKGKLQAR